MPTTYAQADRPLIVQTPLGKDALLVVGFRGQEGLSQLFTFHLEVLAENSKPVAFGRLLGQPVSLALELPSNAERRHFSGICTRIVEEGRDRTFTRYTLTLAPQLWILTRRSQSRIFQHLSVPDILKKALQGLDVSFELQGTYEPRDYCAQYRETDFDFVSRLMEEEGIFYFFKHAAEGHTLVVADMPQSHVDLPHGPRLIFEEVAGGQRAEDRVFVWHKQQDLRSGKVLLWDHCFELPHKHLEAEAAIQDQVQAGTVTHPFKAAGNDKWLLYDWPGDYALRFDGVDRSGGEQPTEVPKIFADNLRTARLRMQQEAVSGLLVRGQSTCRQLVSGFKFSLERHPHANGAYVLTTVQHSATLGLNYRTDSADAFHYDNSFTCIPAALPFRPERRTPRPIVHGTQTAVVVGPPDSEIFTDKYGRVKVQFHWDREGKHDADSSCWVRVCQPWAGKRWGASFWPRVGQEVVVDFQEGNPDQPIIVGSVYNFEQMPPYLGQGNDPKHPVDNKLTGIKSCTTPGGKGFNEWRFDDTAGKEQVFLHAERDLDQRVKNDVHERVGNDRHLIIGQGMFGLGTGDQRELVGKDKHLTVKHNHVELVEGNVQLTVGGLLSMAGGLLPVPGGIVGAVVGGLLGGNLDLVVNANRKEMIAKDDHLHVKGSRKELVDKDDDCTIGGIRKTLVKGAEHLHVVADHLIQIDNDCFLNVGKNRHEKTGILHAIEAGQEIHIRAGVNLVLEAGSRVTLKGPGGFLDINDEGVTIQGLLVRINSGGSSGKGSGCQPKAPEDPASPEDAMPAMPLPPDEADESVGGDKSAP